MNYFKTNPSLVNIWKTILFLIVSFGLYTLFLMKIDIILSNSIYKDVVEGIVPLFFDIYAYYDNEKSLLTIIMTVLLCVIPSIYFIYKLIYNSKTIYEIDIESYALYITFGIFNRETDIIFFDKILDIGKTKNFIEMIFKKGTLDLYTRGDLSNNGDFSMEEKRQMDIINNNVAFGYMSLKKMKSIKEQDLEIIYGMLKNKTQNSNRIV